MVREWRFGSHSFLGYPYETIPWEEWLIESLLTALTHGEQGFALRAIFSAIRYNEKADCPGHLQDALRCAKRRVQDFLI